MRFIELDNGVKFLVLAEVDHDKKHYLYVASVTEEVKYLFLWQKDNDKIEFVEDGNKIQLLLEAVSKSLK